MNDAIKELRPLTAGKLLTIHRKVRAEGGDELEQAAICNARVLAEACLDENGTRVFPDGEAVLSALTFSEMEELLNLLAGKKILPAAVNSHFDAKRFITLREGKNGLH